MNEINMEELLVQKKSALPRAFLYIFRSFGAPLGARTNPGWI
tara:strand:+ start:110 stop:235 length:126 start_codon:yes stop_codon:yes gene_type:complete